jgi:hypothetical protein
LREKFRHASRRIAGPTRTKALTDFVWNAEFSGDGERSLNISASAPTYCQTYGDDSFVAGETKAAAWQLDLRGRHER